MEAARDGSGVEGGEQKKGKREGRGIEFIGRVGVIGFRG